MLTVKIITKNIQTVLQVTLEQGWGGGAPTNHTVENSSVTLQSVLLVQNFTFVDSINPRSYSTYLVKKNKWTDKWTCTVPTRVVQGSAVFTSMDQKKIF